MKAVSAEGRVAVEKAMRPQVDEMVRQAVDSTSPVVYAMAINACHHVLDVAPSPSCQLISTERWTQIDPDDAGPWLRLGNEAAARHDMATADEALYRASVARSFRSVGEALLLYAEPALSSSFSDTDRLQAEWDVLAAQSILGISPMYAAVAQCSEEATEDSNRRQTCDAFANMLLERSSTLERLHWPAGRVTALRQERDALDVAERDLLSSHPGCESLRTVIDRETQHARLGQLASIRASIAASGRSFAELAGIAAARRKEGAKTASAPSAASGS
jgi:hypothetical protein